MNKILNIVFVLLCAMTGWAEKISIKNGERIAFIGDSIVQGGKQPSRYMDLVLNTLEMNRIKVQRIDMGIPGFTSSLVLRHLDERVLKHKPNWIILACGINDIGRWNGGKQILPDQYRNNMREVLKRCKDTGARCYLLTITPIMESRTVKYNQDVILYNNIVQELAKEFHCSVIDVNAAWWREYDRVKKVHPDAKGYLMTYDSIHLNPNGHRILAKEILKAFGFTEDQIAKAEKTWKTLSWRQRVEVEYEMSVEEFDLYAEEAFTKGIPVARSIGTHLKTVKVK